MMKRTLALVLLVLAAASTAGQAAPKLATVQAIADARGDTWRCQDALDVRRTRASRSAASLGRSGRAYRAWVVQRWQTRARACERRKRALVLPESGDWATAVKVAQRVFPGTESWLLSCSGAEGGHGRWVRYGGGSYYPGYEHTDAVGGWMQFRPSTIRDAWPKGYAYTVSRGFIVREMSWFEAWFSPLAQALAAGYYRHMEGSSRHHWSASIRSGCA